MNENPECEDCELSKHAHHRCLESEGNTDCKLAIFLDNPGIIEDRRGLSFVSDGALFVKYCLDRMSVPRDEVYLDYIVKCYPNKGKLPGKKGDRMSCVAACSQYRYFALEQLTQLRALVVLGSLGCETMTQHKTIGDRAGAEWEPISLVMRRHVEHVWVGYSPGLLKEKPAEAGAIFRVIWKAAEEAGLEPQVNLKLKPYEFNLSKR